MTCIHDKIKFRRSIFCCIVTTAVNFGEKIRFLNSGIPEIDIVTRNFFIPKLTVIIYN